ncbi:ankyrin repeat protein [Ancylostoma caninum]|uniref:Ankyrin repeat protein n=1 Tax=Ancylostoma caninum TaxID=29170 RepID=A0A368FLD6_ANCCA|nr:ankyrin repeat protein [Ancylostoma caninum]
MKRFELINELQLSPKDWAHCDANGDNLWHYAARTQDLRAIELFRFIESKGVPIKPNNQGSTPLHEAVQTCDCSANSVLEPIEWLAANCPQVTRDTFGRTPLHYAFASRSQLIESSLADGLRDPIAVVSILSRNMNKQQLDWADCNGNTVLHLAAFKNANICAVTLLRKGVSVIVKNKDGNSPLGVAVLHGRQAVALTLIQADSNVTEQVFPPKTAQLDVDLWKWKGAKEERAEAKVSTIPAQIIAKGGGWEAMVYVLMDALGTNLTSLVQMIDASLKECQYNLANQLTKSLQARLLGKKLPKSDYNLVLTFAEHFRDELAEDGVEHAVLHRLYAVGGELMNDGASLPLEAVVRHGRRD